MFVQVQQECRRGVWPFSAISHRPHQEFPGIMLAMSSRWLPWHSKGGLLHRQILVWRSPTGLTHGLLRPRTPLPIRPSLEATCSVLPVVLQCRAIVLLLHESLLRRLSRPPFLRYNPHKVFQLCRNPSAIHQCFRWF